MRIVVTEESHSRVAWQVRSPLIGILVGLLIAVLFFAALIIFSPSPIRFQAVGVVAGVALVIASVVVVTTPLVDSGYVERQPEGGDVQRTKRWPLVSPRSVVSLDLDEVARFEIETEVFEDAPPDIYSLSRLWAIDKADGRVALTDWAEPSSVQALGDAVSRAGRRDLGAASRGEGSAVV